MLRSCSSFSVQLPRARKGGFDTSTHHRQRVVWEPCSLVGSYRISPRFFPSYITTGRREEKRSIVNASPAVSARASPPALPPRVWPPAAARGETSDIATLVTHSFTTQKMVVSAVVRRWAPLRRSGWMVQFQPGRAAVGLCVPHDISRIVSPGDSCSATAVSAAPSSSSSSSSSFSSVGAGAVASARHALMKRAAWSPLHDGLSMRPSHEQRGGATAPAARTFASEGAAPAGGGMAAVIEITDESQLEGVVTASVASGTALIFDFYANWCGPCKVLTPKIEALVRGTNGAAALVKINVDDHPNISDQLRIQSLPTVMLMVQGRFVDTFKGVLPVRSLRDGTRATPPQSTRTLRSLEPTRPNTRTRARHDLDEIE